MSCIFCQTALAIFVSSVYNQYAVVLVQVTGLYPPLRCSLVNFVNLPIRGLELVCSRNPNQVDGKHIFIQRIVNMSHVTCPLTALNPMQTCIFSHDNPPPGMWTLYQFVPESVGIIHWLSVFS